MFPTLKNNVTRLMGEFRDPLTTVPYDLVVVK